MPKYRLMECSAVHWATALNNHEVTMPGVLGSEYAWSETIIKCPALQCTALFCTALHCTALHCTALHITVLYYTALHSNKYCILH